MLNLNIHVLLPIFMAVAGGLTILLVDIISKQFNRNLNIMLCILFLVLDILCLFSLLDLELPSGIFGLFDLIFIDGISFLAQMIILVASLVFVIFSMSEERFKEFHRVEFYALLLFSVAGFQIMVSSGNLAVILLGLEMSSLSLYAMIALQDSSKGYEASIKYFTMGALAAAFYALGMALLYLGSGSVDIGYISTFISNHDFDTIKVLGAVFILAGVGFKVSAFPFHTWTPDVYEGSNALFAGFMSIVPKIAGFIVLIRFLDVYLSMDSQIIKNILYIMVILTMTVPNLMALVQKDVKRMLAYSSISHAGFILGAIFIHTQFSYVALFLYWFLFLFTNVGAFGMLWISRDTHKVWDTRFEHPYEKFSGLIQVVPLAAITMAVFMLSLIGVPPFGVFFGKMYLIGAVLREDYIFLAVVMMVNSAIASFYYLKLIVYMFLKDPIIGDEFKKTYTANAGASIKAVIGVSALICVCSYFILNPLLSIISLFVSNSGF